MRIEIFGKNYNPSDSLRAITEKKCAKLERRFEDENAEVKFDVENDIENVIVEASETPSEAAVETIVEEEVKEEIDSAENKDSEVK